MRCAIKPTKFENDVIEIDRILWTIIYSKSEFLWIIWENSRKPRELGILSVENHVESVD